MDADDAIQYILQRIYLNHTFYNNSNKNYSDECNDVWLMSQ